MIFFITLILSTLLFKGSLVTFYIYINLIITPLNNITSHIKRSATGVIYI